MNNFQLLRYKTALRIVGYGNGHHAAVMLPSVNIMRPEPNETPFHFLARQQQIRTEPQPKK